MWASKMMRGMGLVALLALAACGTDYSGGDDPNPDPGPGDGCESLTEQECRQDPACSPIFAPGAGFVECGDNDVVVPDGCATNSDCPENYFCEHSFNNDADREAPGVPCACPPCEPGEDCPPCDCGGIEDPIEPPSDGQCVPEPVDGCFSDGDCGPGERCDFSQSPDNGIEEDEDPGAEDPCVCPPCGPGEDCEPCDCGGGALPAPEGICVNDTRDCYDDSECPGDQICSFQTDGGRGSEPEAAPEAPCDCSGDGNCDCEDGDAFIAEPGTCIDPPRYECFDDGDCPSDMECSYDHDGLVPDDGDEDCACPPCEGDDCPPCDCGEPEPAPRPDGLCIPREDRPGCDDGSELICDAEPPLCETGSEAFVRDGCWVCLDPNTCDDSPDACFGAWIDEEGTCRSANDGIAPQECCEMPPINDYTGGMMHNDCAPHDAPALTFILTPQPLMVCEEPSGAYIQITTWNLDQLFNEMFISIEDDTFEGTASYCPGDGSPCTGLRSGELFFEVIEPGEFAVGGGFFEVNGQFINAFFEASHCEAFDLGFCG